MHRVRWRRRIWSNYLTEARSLVRCGTLLARLALENSYSGCIAFRLLGGGFPGRNQTRIVFAQRVYNCQHPARATRFSLSESPARASPAALPKPAQACAPPARTATRAAPRAASGTVRSRGSVSPASCARRPRAARPNAAARTRPEAWHRAKDRRAACRGAGPSP